jgi:protein tyrosine phosphatase
MVVQEKVTLIVTTCNLVEKKVEKCEKFWPDSSCKYGNIEVKCT